MYCKEALWRWMLQICVLEIWPCCDCGFHYFYEAMTCTERVLSKSYREEMTESFAFSLVAASLVKSFQRLNPNDCAWKALMHLVIHRLKRMTRSSTRLYITETGITNLMSRIDSENELYSEHSDSHSDSDEAMVLDEESEHGEDNLKYLDMFVHEGVANMRRPAVHIPHRGCWSEHLSILCGGMSGELIKWSSIAILDRLEHGTNTYADTRLRQEVDIMCPFKKTPETLLKSTMQAYIFRLMAQYGPWVDSMAPKELIWTDPDGRTPENFWTSNKEEWPQHQWKRICY